MHRSALMLSVIAATAVAVPSAGAQSPPRVPSDTAVVAGPTAAGATLVAFDRGGRTCVAVRGVPRDTDPGPLCVDRAPLRLDRVEGRDTIGGSDPLFGVTAPGVATAEIVAPRGTAVSATVQEGGAYRGRLAGRLGFWIADAPAVSRGIDAWRLLRWRDAAGAVVAATTNLFTEDPLVRRPVTVATGVSGGRRWRVRAVTRRVLRPSAAQPERYEDETCLSVGLAGQPHSDFEAACETPDTAAGITPLTTTICGATVAAGLTPSATAQVLVRATDGSRRLATTRPVPGIAGGRRAFAAALPPGTGVRSMTEIGAGGRPRGTLDLGLAPAIGPCRGSELGVSGALVLTSRTVLAAPPSGDAAPPRLVAGDRGDLLCVDVGALRADGADCSPFEPLSFAPGHVLDRAGAGGTVIAGVTLPEVTAVEIATTSGRRLTTPTTDDIGYAGLYRGHVRFFSVTVPGDDRTAWVRFLDATGTTLGYGETVDPPFARAPVVRAHAGGVTLSAGAVWWQRRTVPCLALTPGRPPQQTGGCAALVGRHEAIARAFCHGPALAVAGLAPTGVRRVELVLAGGRRRPLGLVAVPGAGRAYFGVAPRDDAVRGVLLTGGRRELLRAATVLPAAKDQCGYTTPLWAPAQVSASHT